MAKGQKRGNRETRKPKASKAATAPATAATPLKGALTPAAMPKQKKG